MKRMIMALAVISCFLAAPLAQAQLYQPYYKLTHPNEISLSYGASVIGTAIGTVVNYASLISDFADDELTLSNSGTKGWINLGYSYQLNKTISLGLAVSYYNVGVKMTDNTGTVKSSANVIPILTTGKFDWFRTRADNFGMYSKLGLGVVAVGGQLVEDDVLSKTVWLPMFHASLIGLEFGRAFGGFMELGAGAQGVFQIGIRGRF